MNLSILYLGLILKYIATNKKTYIRDLV